MEIPNLDLVPQVQTLPRPLGAAFRGALIMAQLMQ